MLTYAEPAGDEGDQLPLPGVDPEHDELRNAVVKILAEVAECFKTRTEAGWLHPDIGVRNCSQNQEGDEVGEETSESETLGTQSIDFDALVANNWVQHQNGEEVGESWRPELVVAVKESSVSIANTPEPEGGQQVRQILLSHVGIFLVLVHEGRQ